MATKRQRQHVVQQLLADHAVSSQGQLVDLLADAGIDATQATVSRDLDELGAVKVRVSGDTVVYAIPELPTDQHLPEDHLRRVLGEWLVEVGHAHNIVMMRTPPGSAHVVASALDRRGLDEVLGTVAGDDTIMVVAAESTTGEGLAAMLRDLAGLE
jgi:transcriptional regulator of arginine metabolism